MVSDFEYEGRHGPNDRLGDNRPLRDWKGSLYEGGIRVPAFLNWPSRLEPRRVEQVSSAIDLYPTIASLSGALIPECASIEGRNLWEAASDRMGLPLKGPFTGELPTRRLYGGEPGNWFRPRISGEKAERSFLTSPMIQMKPKTWLIEHPEIVSSLSGETSLPVTAGRILMFLRT